MLLILVLVGLAAQFVSKCDACADPYTPKGKGNAVVAEVVNKINNLGIFPNDHKFLCRVAWVESKYGQARGTYRSGYYGGIWQVDSIGYRETVIQKRLKKYWDQIKARLGIDWTKTQWQDLEKPLYSGLAARLFLVRFRAPIPSDVLSQARYWKRYYNTSAGKGTVQKFIDDVEQGTGCVA
ncbi:uncharacterized protein LOC110043706 [Orbicella faveolata]|uniref:uncharacterized protein LOC110043706 n=1 Tax=Orbicella faveolata TaxID=48498 RepID=UPI0009E4EDE1|nr:uncharacterized protein LOC110043706 [Orbicella faveolata]